MKISEIECMDILCNELIEEFYGRGNSVEVYDDDYYIPSSITYFDQSGYKLTYWYDRDMNVVIYHDSSDPTEDYSFIPAPHERARFMYIVTFFQDKDNWFKAVQNSCDKPLFNLNKKIIDSITTHFYGDDEQ